MIRFEDLFQVDQCDLGKYKVHYASKDGSDDPLDAFIQDEFKIWQENQRRHNFTREYILSLISLGNDDWLFAGVFHVESSEKINGRRIYKTNLVENNIDLIGRLIIQYQKVGQQSYRYLEKDIHKYSISELRKEKYSLKKFPGYANVQISFPLLKLIIQHGEPTWLSALMNVKGVYLISDRSNGKKYIGAAYGQEAFWSRWKQYLECGHGGNVGLKEELGDDIVNRTGMLVFSILEFRSMNTPNDEIIDRETYWKDILMTRTFGYNRN